MYCFPLVASLFFHINIITCIRPPQILPSGEGGDVFPDHLSSYYCLDAKLLHFSTWSPASVNQLLLARCLQPAHSYNLGYALNSFII